MRTIRDPCSVIGADVVVSFLVQWLGIAGSTNDKTCVWTIALTEYVFMADTTFVISARPGACSQYSTLSNRFEKWSRGVLSRLSDMILDVLKYLGLCELVVRTGSDPVWIALE